MGSHWVKKIGQNRKNHHVQNLDFRLPRGHRFFAKNGSCSYGAKSRWGPLRVYQGANGVPFGKKKWVKTWKITMPQNSNFHDPRSSIFPKKWKLRLWRQITVGTPRVHLRANGVPLGKKKGSKPSKITMPQNSNCRLFRTFDDPTVIDFSKKMEVTVLAPNHGGDTLGSILGPMGSHWVQKMGQNRKNYHSLKFEVSTTPRSSIFLKKWKLRLWRQITVGTP